MLIVCVFVRTLVFAGVEGTRCANEQESYDFVL